MLMYLLTDIAQVSTKLPVRLQAAVHQRAPIRDYVDSLDHVYTWAGRATE